MGIVYECERCGGEIRPFTNITNQPCRACLVGEIKRLRACAMEGRMNGKRRWTKESKVRLLMVVGILLSLFAYLLFLGIPSPWNTIFATPTVVAALCTSFYGLWSWNAHQKGGRTRSPIGLDIFKEYNSLGPRDFENGAVKDGIARALEDREQLIVAVEAEAAVEAEDN